MTAAAAVLRPLALGAAIALLTGCAVMRIDVDVYKGPLADEIDVQTQEFVAMAIGAKPLLIQLRDLLQWPKDEDRECARNQKSPDYEAGYFVGPHKAQPNGEDCPLGAPDHWNERAERVNGVLSLYLHIDDVRARDRTSPSPLETSIINGLVQGDKFKEQLGVFNNLDKPEQALWKTFDNEITKNLDAIENKYKGLLNLQPSDKFFNNLKTAANALKNKYREIFNSQRNGPSHRTVKGLIIVFNNYINVLDTQLTASLKKQRSTNIRNKINDEAASVRASRKRLKTRLEGHDASEATGRVFEYWLLSDAEIVSDHAKILFGSAKSPTAEKFIARVVEKAGAYFGMRKAIRNMWLVALDSLILIDSEKFVFPEKKTALIALAADLISVLSQPEHIAVATNIPVSKAFNGTLKQLKRFLDETGHGIWDPPPSSKSISDIVWDFDVINRSVRLAVVKRPTEMAKLLIEADATLKEFAKREIIKLKNQSLPSPRSLAREVSLLELNLFGLSRGPSFGDAEKELRLVDIKSNLQSQKNTIGRGTAGLDKGRLEKGIEDLIKEYLEASTQPASSGNKPDTIKVTRKVERDNLLEALVRFSKKILIIADNDKLLRDPLSDTGTKLDRYVLVLQAIGNSIRIQADELKQREKHEKKLEDRTYAEAWAVETALARSAKSVIEDVLAELKSLQESASKDIADSKKRADDASGKFKQIETTALKAQTDEKVAKAALQRAMQDLETLMNKQPQYDAAVQILTNTGGISIPDFIKTNSSEPDVGGAKMADEILAWLNKEKQKHLTNFPKKMRLENAVAFFSADPSTVRGFDSMPRADVLKEMAKVANSNLQEIKKKIAATKSLILKLQSNAKNFARALEDANKDKAKGEFAVTSEATKLRTATESKAHLELAVAAVREVLTKVILTTQQAEASDSAAAVFWTIVAVVNQELVAATAASEAAPNNKEGKAKQKRFQAAADVLRAINPPLEKNIFAGLKDNTGYDRKNARVVLDEMIALLRHEHILAVRQWGEDSPRARHINNALATAYEQRAGMTYIRPSGAYLRSSYPATALQDDPRLGWSNMLGQHGFRTLPFIGGAFAHSPDERKRLEIQSEIDKQFWQTINSVRVAGAGITNYVMAKDDIGNWYVKSYSANPAPIIKSAKSLALLGLGGQFDSNLVSKVRDQKGIDPEKDDESTPATGMGRLLEKHRSKYAKTTGEDYTALKNLVDSSATSPIVTDLNQALRSNRDTKDATWLGDLETSVETASGEALTTAKGRLTDKKDPAEQALEINVALTEVKTFYPIFQAKLQALDIVTNAKKDLASDQKQLKTLESERAAKQSELEAAKIELAEKPEDLGLQNEIERLTGELAAKQTAVDEAQKRVHDAEQKVTSAGNAEATALSEAARIVRKHLKRVTVRRFKAVDDYETAVIFIGDANNPPKKEQTKSGETSPGTGGTGSSP